MQKTAGNNFIIADGRWSGANGIGRFSREVLARLQHADIFTRGCKPLSLTNLFWQTRQLKKFSARYRVFFTPGFNPVIHPAMPYVFTVHDLIHLSFPGKAAWLKKLYYEKFMRPAIQRAHKVLTVSEYSKKTIVEWANIPSKQVVVVGNGVSTDLTPTGEKYQPGFPYLLHVGNTKAHKNVARLIQAFAQANIAKDMRLILTGDITNEIFLSILKNQIQDRVIFTDTLDEKTLHAYYRGASALVLPSLYEGFGLPVIEAMACGTPVLTSNVTSLPEVAGDAALLVDPLDIDAMASRISKIVNDDSLRQDLITRGLLRAKLFSWDVTAEKVQQVLNDFA